MVQHIFVMQNFDGTVGAQPPVCNIWRDDQAISWKIAEPLVAAGWQWDNTTEPGGPPAPNAAIQFSGTNPWQGSVPVPIGPPPSGTEKDTRQYSAMGPGANAGSTVANFSYNMFLLAPDGTRHIIRNPDVDIVDPEIGNQPQP